MIVPPLRIPASRALADAARLRELFGQRNVKYGRWTYTCELVPAVLTWEERALIAQRSEEMLRAAELVTDLVLRDAALRAHYEFSPTLWELILQDPGYGLNIPCARFDAVLSGGSFKFIELNTDGCSGMTNVDGMHAAYMEVCGSQADHGLEGMGYDKVVPHVLETLLTCYARFREHFPSAQLPEEPVVAILDLAGEPTHWEFTAIREALGALGICAHVVTPEEARFDGRTLTFREEPVHLIYRRLLGSDYATHFDTLAPVTAAFTSRRVCMVGALRSQIAFSKRLFALLHDARVQRALPDDLVAVIQRHVPWTAVLQPGRVRYRGEEIELVPFVRTHRELFVIKPCVSKLGFGITQGRYVDEDTWDRAVEQALAHDCIVQEFVELPTAAFPTPDDPATVTKRYVHLGPYVFGGKFSGILGRTCADPLLSLRTGERLLPVLYGEGKRCEGYYNSEKTLGG